MQELHNEYRKIESLKPAPRNARTHSKRQIDQIKASLQAFGWTNPILINDRGAIVAGHGRFEAAKLLEMGEVPTIRLSQLSNEQCRLYALADNRLAEKAGWDRDLLRLELGELAELDLDLSLELTGFEMGEIDIILDGEAKTDPIDEVAEPSRQQPAVTLPGDVWILGKHRIICGNALEPATYESLLIDQLADMVFCDPPYNVRIDGHVSGLGKVQHREFEMASGEMSEDEFTAFLEKAFRLLGDFARDGSIHFQCIDWRHLYEMLHPRGLPTDEIVGVGMVLTSPRRRCTTLGARRWSFGLALGEFCWHASGRDDVESLAYYAIPQ